MLMKILYGHPDLRNGKDIVFYLTQCSYIWAAHRTETSLERCTFPHPLFHCPDPLPEEFNPHKPQPSPVTVPMSKSREIPGGSSTTGKWYFLTLQNTIECNTFGRSAYFYGYQWWYLQIVCAMRESFLCCILNSMTVVECVDNVENSCARVFMQCIWRSLFYAILSRAQHFIFVLCQFPINWAIWS